MSSYADRIKPSIRAPWPCTADMYCQTIDDVAAASRCEALEEVVGLLSTFRDPTAARYVLEKLKGEMAAFAKRNGVQR